MGSSEPGATDLVSEALLVWAVSLPFQGASLLFSRAFFSLQRPWTTTALAGGSLVVNALVALALYEPLGIAGVVLGTAVATVALAVAQAVVLGGHLGGVEARQTASAVIRMVVAAAALAGVSLLVWSGLDDWLGRSLLGAGRLGGRRDRRGPRRIRRRGGRASRAGGGPGSADRRRARLRRAGR